MAEWPYDVIPPPLEYPTVIPYPNTVRTLPLPVLLALAAIAGATGFAGPPIPPDDVTWALRVLRKLVWRELHRRRRAVYLWDDMLTARGPHK